MRVAFISGGRARPIPKPLRIAMKADQDLLGRRRIRLTVNRPGVAWRAGANALNCTENLVSTDRPA